MRSDEILRNKTLSIKIMNENTGEAIHWKLETKESSVMFLELINEDTRIIEDVSILTVVSDVFLSALNGK